MSRTSRFISLSGLSGVSTGVIALLGVLAAYLLVFKDQAYLTHQAVELSNSSLFHLLMIGTATLILSIASALFFTNRKTKTKNQPIWDMQAKRLL